MSNIKTDHKENHEMIDTMVEVSIMGQLIEQKDTSL